MVACTDWPASPERARRIAGAYLAIDGRGHEFAELLERHRVLALAVRSIRQAGLAVPRELTARAEAEQTRALSLAALSLDCIRVLEEAGIPVVPLKGPWLSDLLYDDPAIRHSVDIDILVDWDNFAAAIALFERRGFRVHGSRPPFGDWRIDPWRRLAKDITLIDPSGRFAIELHHRLKTPETLLSGLGMAQAGEALTMGGVRVPAFSREDLFAYLCAHAATSLWDRLKWLVDIHVLTQDLADDDIVQWQARSERLGTGRCSLLALLLLAEVWGRSLPPQLAERAGADQALRGLLKASRVRLLAKPKRRSGIANSFARRHILRLRDGRSYRRAVWFELVNDRELLERYALVRRLRWLYVPLRVALFLKRKVFGERAL